MQNALPLISLLVHNLLMAFLFWNFEYILLLDFWFVIDSHLKGRNLRKHNTEYFFSEVNPLKGKLAII